MNTRNAFPLDFFSISFLLSQKLAAPLYAEKNLSFQNTMLTVSSFDLFRLFKS